MLKCTFKFIQQFAPDRLHPMQSQRIKIILVLTLTTCQFHVAFGKLYEQAYRMNNAYSRDEPAWYSYPELQSLLLDEAGVGRIEVTAIDNYSTDFIVKAIFRGQQMKKYCSSGCISINGKMPSMDFPHRIEIL